MKFSICKCGHKRLLGIRTPGYCNKCGSSKIKTYSLTEAIVVLAIAAGIIYYVLFYN